MHSGSDGKNKKRPYIPPTITKLPLEKAKRLITERTHCSEREAMDLLDSLRREQQMKQRSDKPSAGDEWERSA